MVARRPWEEDGLLWNTESSPPRNSFILLKTEMSVVCNFHERKSSDFV